MAIGGILAGISSLVGVFGSFQEAKFKQAQAKEAAEVGRINADQIDTAYRDELSSTLNNIRAIRATTGAAADSPTSIAVQDKQEEVSDRNRSRDVANRKMQANSDEASGKFLGSSASMSLFGGVAKSLPKFFGA